VIGGWQINGISTFQKGIPLAISNGGNSTGLNSPGIRATDNGQNPQVTVHRRSAEQLFCTSAFSQTANYTFGNVGRFCPMFARPGQHNLDSPLFKNFRPVEKLNFQSALKRSISRLAMWLRPEQCSRAPRRSGS